MDGRDCAKCQKKSRKRDTNGIIKFVNDNETKESNSGLLHQIKRPKIL